MNGILSNLMAKLYLIPNTLSEEASASSIAAYVASFVKHIRVFFVEEPKSARALLKKINPDFPLSECKYIDLNEHTSIELIEEALNASQGQDIGIISEAGYPCVADPGANLVRLAHVEGRPVVPLAGASSIILALAASGLNGQNFAFNGYMPKDKAERFKKIRSLEQRSHNEGQTQILMEPPYRSQSLLDDILAACNPKTQLCVASDITGPNQMIHTRTIEQWKKNPITLFKRPTLFLLLYI